MSINEFIQMNIFLLLICFPIYDKMQGFVDESGLFFYLFIYIFFAFYAEIQVLSCSVPERTGFCV